MNLENPIRPWENVLWTPEPLFLGGTVFCIASGPSLTQSDCDKIKGRKSIVVNSSCRFAPWADVLYFTDQGWYMDRRELVKNWPGLVVTMARIAKRELDDPSVNKTGVPRILRIKGCGDPGFPPRLPGMPIRLGFPPVGSPEIQQGRTSGHTAVSLAIAMGANRVVLLGYDMQIVAGREHCHDEYTGPRDLSLYDSEGYKKGFFGWNEAARNSGVQILNATHGSAVTEFPFVELDEVLKCDQF